MSAGPEIRQLIQWGTASAVIKLVQWLGSQESQHPVFVPAALDTKDKQYDRSSG